MISSFGVCARPWIAVPSFVQRNRSDAAAPCDVLYPAKYVLRRMDGATLNIVGTKIKPVIFVKVDVQPENNLANIMVERVELDGSEAVRSAGGSFNGKDYSKPYRSCGGKLRVISS